MKSLNLLIATLVTALSSAALTSMVYADTAVTDPVDATAPANTDATVTGGANPAALDTTTTTNTTPNVEDNNGTEGTTGTTTAPVDSTTDSTTDDTTDDTTDGGTGSDS